MSWWEYIAVGIIVGAAGGVWLYKTLKQPACDECVGCPIAGNCKKEKRRG